MAQNQDLELYCRFYLAPEMPRVGTDIMSQVYEDADEALPGQGADLIWRAHFGVVARRGREIGSVWIEPGPRKVRPVGDKFDSHNYRAMQYGVDSSLSFDDWLAVLDAHGRSCLYCGDSNDLTIDHIHPMSLGGPNTIDNVVPACSACNTSKGRRSVDAWLIEQGIDVREIEQRISEAQSCLTQKASRRSDM